VYSGMIPKGKEGQMMGYWTLSCKLLAWTGSLTFVGLHQVFGSAKAGVFGLGIWFILACIPQSMLAWSELYARLFKIKPS